MSYYEDYVIGKDFRSAARTVTEADVVNFAGVSGDFSQLHTDAEYANQSRYGGRVAHGLLGLAIAQGLIWATNFYATPSDSSEKREQAGGNGGSLGWDNWRFKQPIRIGDTVHVRWQISRKRESQSISGMGIITEAIELVNQHGDIVQSGEHSTLVPCHQTAGKASG